jgi:hypothetical protein
MMMMTDRISNEDMIIKSAQCEQKVGRSYLAGGLLYIPDIQRERQVLENKSTMRVS